jgi:LuxR family transcriptional regulator, quorum-sensing system regulator CciR
VSARGKPSRDPPTTDYGSLDIYRNLAAAPDRPALRAAVLAAARNFGFTAVYYLLQVTRDPTAGRVIINQGMPEVWERQYRRRLRLIDPLPDYAMDIMHIFRWGSVLETIPLSRAQKRYRQFLQDLGMGDGLAIAIWGPGGRCGFIGFGMPHNEAAFDVRNYVGLHLAAQISFNRHCNLVEDVAAGTIRLSPREMEILHWAARGKSNPDMATILGISRATVDTYMRRVFQKFGTNDRTVACLRAHELGFIHISSLPASEPSAS